MKRVAALALTFAFADPALAERICVEEAGGVCLKYRDVPSNDFSAAERALSGAERRAVQSRLGALGFYQGGVDGLFGPGTRRAIAAWQKSEGLSATGRLTAAQIEALNAIPATQSAPAEAALSLEAMLVGARCGFTTPEGARATAGFRTNGQLSVETDDGGLNGRWTVGGGEVCMSAQGRKVCIDIPDDASSKDDVYAAMRAGCTRFRAP